MHPQPSIVSKYEQVSSSLSLYARYALAGGICCQATHTILVPMDVVKTRLQTSATHYGAIALTKAIVTQEGYRSLLLGMTPTFVGYSLQGAFKFALNEALKNLAYSNFDPQHLNRNKVPLYLGCAAVAEGVASIALCPWEAIRIRMVSAPVGVKMNTVQTMRSIISEAGFTGFYKGLPPLLAKQVPYTMTQLTVFNTVVETFYDYMITHHARTKDSFDIQQQLLVTVGAGTMAGIASAIASHPADTLLSRINMASGNVAAGAVQTPARQSIPAILKQIGFRGLWLGLGPRCVMVSALSAGMFLIYDTVKLACGLPTSGH